MTVVEMTGVEKIWRTPGGAPDAAVRIRSFRLEAGEELAVRGQSGSGKTTFLNLIAGILKPDCGTIRVAGAELSAMTEAGRDRHRALHVGYVFQSFNLLQGYTALENVLLSMRFGRGMDEGEARRLLDRVGLSGRLGHRPGEMSAGQQQRVAIARALANRPDIVLADEPTGNLDEENSKEALRLLREACHESGATLLVVSHDSAALDTFSRTVSFTEIAGARTAGREPAEGGP